MTFRVFMDGEHRSLIRHMAPAQKQKIKESLRAIAREPREGKPLQENLLGLFGYRVGSLRIIYSIDDKRKMVQIVAIGPRRTIYEELERILAKESER